MRTRPPSYGTISISCTVTLAYSRRCVVSSCGTLVRRQREDRAYAPTNQSSFASELCWSNGSGHSDYCQCRHPMVMATVPGCKRGTDVRRATPYRAASVSRIAAPLAAVGGPGMAARPATRCRAATAHPIKVRSAAPRADGMAIEFKRTQARRYLLGSLVIRLLGRLLGRPHARPEFCRENFVLRTRF
jgi:hypothetical protein